MRIIVTGSKGQLGKLVIRSLEREHDVIGLDLPDFELTAPDSTATMAAYAPDLVIHLAAITDVDGCARNPALAFRVNALGTQSVALACQRANAAMLYMSTNEVFDGEKQGPYLEFDTANPINPYARSKLAGEWYTQQLLQRFYIVRTSWLYTTEAARFPDKILDLARQGAPLAGVVDELGCPTFAPDLVEAMCKLITTERFGIYHLVNAGFCSRYEWMVEVLKGAGIARPVKPIKQSEYHRASRPPKNGALENFVAATALGITLRPWEEGLAAFFKSRERMANSG